MYLGGGEERMAQTKRVFISYLQGAGSILEIVPPSSYEHFIPRESFNERLQANFHRVGGALRYGMDVWTEERSQDTEQTELRTAS